MEHILEMAAYVDWKEESEEIVFALRASYGELYPALGGGVLDDLAENYADEEPEDFLKALGQELTGMGLALYTVEDDSDSYGLMVLPLEQAQDFKTVLKSHKRKGTFQKQPRRKEGTPAKRIDLGKRLPCEKAALPAGGSFDLIGDVYEDRLWLHMRREGTIYSAIWDLAQWPPVLTEKKDIVVCRLTVREDGLMAAIAQHNELNEKGYLADQNKSILVGREWDDIWSWNCLWTEKSPDWTELKWVQDDLFVVSGGAVCQGKVFRIKGAAKGAGRAELLLKSPAMDKRGLIFPQLFTVGDRLYLFIKPTLYEWRGDGFLRKGGFHKTIAKIEDAFVDGFVPVGDSKVAFVTGTGSKPGDSVDGTLHVLDLLSGARQTYPCCCGYLHKWNDSRVCVCMPPSDGGAKTPIMECFDLDTGEKRSLMPGALGKDGIRDIQQGSGGTLLLGYRNVLYRTENLWGVME